MSLMSNAKIPHPQLRMPITHRQQCGLQADDVTLNYDECIILNGLSVSIPDKSFTVIVGPNACGKSTLLRALSRLLKPSNGDVILDGKSIHAFKAKEVASRLGQLCRKFFGRLKTALSVDVIMLRAVQRPRMASCYHLRIASCGSYAPLRCQQLLLKRCETP